MAKTCNDYPGTVDTIRYMDVRPCPCCGENVQVSVEGIGACEIKIAARCKKCGISMQGNIDLCNEKQLDEFLCFIARFLAKWNRRVG